jgi:opacity protein-like surface antigen
MVYRLMMFVFCFVAIVKVNAQEGFGFSVGTTYTNLEFPLFNDYVSSYNTLNSGSGLQEELSFQPGGLGMNVGMQYRILSLYTGINMSRTATFASKAVFSSGERNYTFKNYTFDVIAGFTIKSLLSPYITLSINAMNIESYYSYSNGIKSYGSEFGISGIYSSSRMFVGAGLRLEKKINRFGFALDGCYPINATHYLGGSFEKQANASDSPLFPQNQSDFGTLDLDKSLPETYRNIRFSASLIYYLTK